MKTYPLHREDGKLHAFEIPNMWVTVGAIKRLLRSVDGVSDVKRTRTDDFRATFIFHGEPMAVWEPWGDNSRYVVVPINDESEVNLDSLHDTFKRHKRSIARLWSRVIRKA